MGEWLAAVATHPVTLIGVGSAVGGNLRFWLGRWVDAQAWPGGLPWGTLVINVSGSFLLGFFAVAFVERVGPPRREAYLLLGTGFCGGYTTFSTFEWETYKLLREGHYPAALGNVAASCVVGFVAVAAGALLASLILGKR